MTMCNFLFLKQLPQRNKESCVSIKGYPRTAVVQRLFTRMQSKTARMGIQRHELNNRHAAHMGNVISAAMRTASASVQSSVSQPGLGAAQLCFLLQLLHV